MCIVIDTNTLSCVFNTDDANHNDFEPVSKWILEDKGKVVFGGTKYMQELEKAPKYLKLFELFRQVHKVVIISAAEVDKEQKTAEQKIQDKDFDDPHIVGILKASGCKLVCSRDSRSFPYITHKVFFTKRNKPKIYSTKRNADLLCDNNIAACCKPSSKTTKAQINKMEGLV